MQVMIFILLIISSLSFAGKLDGLMLIQAGKLGEGYSKLEESFQVEEDFTEKGRLAYLLAFAPAEAVQSSPVYYARFALKYHSDLSQKDNEKLKIRIADSYMEFGELTKAYEMYQDVLKNGTTEKDYINYQLGYYYLNQKASLNAYQSWMKLVSAKSDLKSHALRSLGRYWEKLNFLGDITYLSSEKEFMDGFSVSVDEREKGLTIKDLNQFSSRKSTAEMLTLLIQKNTLFVKAPCEFVKWYDVKLSLPNNLIYPYLHQCGEQDKKLVTKITEIARATAENLQEKKFLISLYEKQNLGLEACELGYKEKLLHVIFSFCRESSKEMTDAILLSLNGKDEDKSLLKASRVIRSSFELKSKDQKKIVEIVGEGVFVEHFLDTPEKFISLAKSIRLSEESLLTFALYHRMNKEKRSLVFDLFKTKEGIALFTYLDSVTPYSSDVCSLKNDTFKKLALESKIISGTTTKKDLSCSGALIESNSALKLLAYEKIVETSELIKIKKSFRLEEELLVSSGVLPPVETILSLSGGWGKDLSLLLRVQDFRIKSVQNEEALLKELKVMKRLRSNITSHKWSSKILSTNTMNHFNNLLQNFVQGNETTLNKLNLVGQVDRFIHSLRFS